MVMVYSFHSRSTSLYKALPGLHVLKLIVAALVAHVRFTFAKLLLVSTLDANHLYIQADAVNASGHWWQPGERSFTGDDH